MTPADFAVIFRNAALSNYVLPGLILALCTFGGAVISFGLSRKRTTTVIPGVFFTVSGLYLGDRYTAISLLFFALAVCFGLFIRFKHFPARVRRASQVRRPL